MRLTDFRVFYESGELYTDYPTYVDPPEVLDYDDMKPRSWCFKKTGFCATGSCGVLSYNVQNRAKKSLKLNVMWSAPFNHDHYVNWFAVGFSQVSASEELFKKMYYSEHLEGFNRRPSTDEG